MNITHHTPEEWKAFYHAYDSAMRTFLRGPEVSRAVNWLYVASREGATDGQRETERENRDIGVRVGLSAKTVEEIAPLCFATLSGEKTGERGRP